MVHHVVDSIGLATSCLALYFVLRVRKTYFLDSRFFMAAANLGFIGILLQQLLSDLSGAPPSETFYVIMIAETALSVGFASYLLSRNRGASGLKELTGFLSDPPKSFLVYSLVVIAWVGAEVLLQPWKLTRTFAPEGVTYYYHARETWGVVSGSVVLVAFMVFPVLNSYRQGTHLVDSKAARSIRIISASWGAFGAVAFVQATVGGSFSLVAQSVGTIADSLLFIVVAFALREPTILSRIIAAGELGQHTVNELLGPDTIVLYNVDSDRKKMVEAFVKQRLTFGQDAVCFVGKAELPFYTAIIREVGPRSIRGAGQVSIQPIDASIGTNPTIPPGFSRVRSELIDFGELDIGQCSKLLGTIGDLDALPGPGRMSRVWALNIESAHPSLLNMIREMSPNARTVDLAGHQDSFAGLLGLKHEAVLGARILVEYDPSSNYEETVQMFAREFQANVEPVAIFTSLGSPVHRQLQKLRDVRLFTFSTKTSTPTRLSDREVLLPERDSSLMLDAVDKLLQTNHGRRIGLVFDVFTDLIVFQGFEKAYGALSSIVEMTESQVATTLVLVNSEALDERVLNGVRGLFRSQLKYGKDGIEFSRFRNLYTGRKHEDSTLEESRVSLEGEGR